MSFASHNLASWKTVLLYTLHFLKCVVLTFVNVLAITLKNTRLLPRKHFSFFSFTLKLSVLLWDSVSMCPFLLILFFSWGDGVQGFELYHLRLTFSLFHSGYFRDGVLWTIYLGLPWIAILSISASQVAKITGVSHWCGPNSVFNHLCVQNIAECRKH
jgi:hypothetical protein